MSHYDDDERVLEGTAKHLKAMRQYRNLDSGFKEILDISITTAHVFASENSDFLKVKIFLVVNVKYLIIENGIVLFFCE